MTPTREMNWAGIERVPTPALMLETFCAVVPNSQPEKLLWVAVAELEPMVHAMFNILYINVQMF